MFTAVWAISTVIVGSASLSKVGSTGAVENAGARLHRLVSGVEPEGPRAARSVPAGASAADRGDQSNSSA